jgi:hypothetical protein
MKIENKKKVARLRRIFYLVSVIIALGALALFLFDYTYYALATVGVFSLWLLYFMVADYQYIHFSDANNKILLRFFKAIRFGKGEYSSIEFPKEMLKDALFENSVFGKLSDLTLIIRTKRGVAEYPSVSLSALSLNERKQIQQILNDILNN